MGERGDDGGAPTAEASTELPIDLPIARPPIDPVRMATVRARAEQSLFGSAAPARFGRYVLVGDHADGGMGVVYAAYDPDLHRKVALKVLHPRRQGDDAAHARLIAEARALARLDHPNVVKVHDVISHGGQIVIVMEWVEGTTLAAWERERRPWRDVVAVYLQAGHGLAAAHGVGVVHRDVKPANVIVGADGRVRVLDFGLARPATGANEQAGPHLAGSVADGSGGHGWAAGVTATGDMVGTLAYAAPEQIAGEPVTPASDQFSFGVALHRALEGTPPFPGDNALELVRAIRGGRVAIATDGRTVPPWLRAIVLRSLAADPAARFPSMTALLRELARPRGWRRWRVPLAVTACAAVAAAAVLTRPAATDPLADCDGGAPEIATVWNPAARARLEASLDAIATPSARDARDRVLPGLDRYRDRWTAVHRDACLAHRRGEQSAALLDRRMLCLQRHLGDLRASVAVLQQLDAASAGNATDVVSRMPSVASCGDLERLQADTEPPATPAQRAAVDAVRTQLSQAAALDRAGRSTEALAAATAAGLAAEQTGYPPLVADAALLRGRILMSQRDLTAAAAIDTLTYARTAALEQHRFSIAVEAAARKIFVEGMQTSDLPAAEREAAVFLPIAQGLRGDHFARPLLLNNLGTVALAAQDHAQAVHYFQTAHDALTSVPEPDLELTVVDENLALVTEDARRREDLARGAWTRFHDALGEANLSTIEALEVYARVTTDLAAALTLLRRACTDYDQFHPDMLDQRVHCRSYCGFLASYLGDRDLALRIYDEMIAMAAGSTDEEIASWRQLATGHARFLRGDPDGAEAAWKPIATAYGDSPVWWVRLRAADAELGLGRSAHARGHDRDARALLEAAIAGYLEASATNQETEHRIRRALAERTLAEVRTSTDAQ